MELLYTLFIAAMLLSLGGYALIQRQPYAVRLRAETRPGGERRDRCHRLADEDAEF